MALWDHGVVRAAAGFWITSAPKILRGPEHRDVSRLAASRAHRNRVWSSSSVAPAPHWAGERGAVVGWQCPGMSVPLQCCLLYSRYLKQISELTFPEEEQLKKFNHLKTYNLQEEMKSLR